MSENPFIEKVKENVTCPQCKSNNASIMQQGKVSYYECYTCERREALNKIKDVIRI